MVVSKIKKEGFQKPPLAVKPIRLFKLSEIERENVKWLWYPYIPAGKLTLLEGDPGQGKSWITCSLAADLSMGRPLPGMKEPLPPQNILMFSSEDGLGDTVLPRIADMGGDLQRINVSNDFFTLDNEGIGRLETAMRNTAATIVFLDPIVAYMGGKIDMHRANEVRELMAGLSAIAASTGSALVAVRHLRKAQGGKAIYSGIGSIDFTASARSVLQVRETDGGTKYMYHAKHNLTPKGNNLAYTIDTVFKWQGVLAEEEADKKVSKKSKLIANAERFIIEVLKDGPILAMDMRENAAKKGISMTTINRAKEGMAYSKKVGTDWYWFLEGQEGKVDVPEQTTALPADILAEARARLAAARGV